MKKLLALLCIVLALPTLARAADNETAFDRILRTGTLRCGYTSAPPYLTIDPNTRALSGIQYDIVNEMGRRMDVKIEWAVEAGFSTAVADLQAGKYDKLQFLLGVDSIRNCSGAQTGALDPMNGMFWTWNSGYIMFKLEGNSTASTADLQRIEHHIGGYKGSDNVATVIHLDFNTTKLLEIKAGATTELVIETNLDNYWNGNASIKIAELPMCMITGEPALKVAKNFTGLFSVKEINQAP